MAFPGDGTLDSRLKRNFPGFLLGVLLILVTGFLVFHHFESRNERVSEAKVVWRALSTSLGSMLAKNDRQSAGQYFDSFAEFDRICSAVLFTRDGTPLAEYKSNLHSGPIPETPGESGIRMQGSQIQVVFPLAQEGGKLLGTFYLCLSLTENPFLWPALAGLVFLTLLIYVWWNKDIFAFFIRRFPVNLFRKTEGVLAMPPSISPKLRNRERLREMPEEEEARPSPWQSQSKEDIEFLQMEERLKYEVQVRKQAEDILATHHRILEQLAKGNSLEDVLDLVGINLERQMGLDTTSAIFMVEEDGIRLTLKSAPHLDEHWKNILGEWDISLEGGPFGISAHNNEIVILEKIQEDPRWAKILEDRDAADFKSCWAVPIPDPTGKPIGVVGIVCRHPRSPSVDELKNLNSSAFLAGMAITRKRYEENLKNYSRELVRSNQDLDEFASIASHDLQEPLRKVMAFGERLKKNNGENLDKRGQDYLDRMLRGTVRMQHFISDLLKYSRAGARTKPLVCTELDQIVNDVLIDFEFRIEETGAAVKVGPLPVIEADDVQIHQVFSNLIGNALKFIREGESPFVEITSRKIDDQYVEIDIKDNGIGFENNLSERIFKPFERLNSTGAFAGSGMGLALCRKIVERHGGTITAFSEPGKGTRITLQFPLPQKTI